jgi:hypothetical protein
MCTGSRRQAPAFLPRRASLHAAPMLPSAISHSLAARFSQHIKSQRARLATHACIHTARTCSGPFQIPSYVHLHHLSIQRCYV